jgi:hypothetical protein
MSVPQNGPARDPNNGVQLLDAGSPLSPEAFGNLLREAQLPWSEPWVWLATATIDPDLPRIEARIAGNHPYPADALPAGPDSPLRPDFYHPATPGQWDGLWWYTFGIDNATMARDWAGYQLTMLGTVLTCTLDGLTLVTADPVPMGPTWGMRDNLTGNLIVRLQPWYRRAQRGDEARRFAELRWAPSFAQARDYVGIYEQAPSEHERANDQAAAEKGLSLLRGMPLDARGQSPRRGRKTLEDTPTHTWRLFADQADEMLRREPWRPLEYVVGALQVPGPNVDARIRKLQRWRQRRHLELAGQ